MKIGCHNIYLCDAFSFDIIGFFFFKPQIYVFA